MERNFYKNSLSQEYKEKREWLASREPEIPAVHLYPLSEREGRKNFIDSLRRFPDKEGLPSWSSTEPDELILEALTKNILTDRFHLHLEDYAKLKRPQGYFDDERGEKIIRRFTQIEDTWENSTIAEYSWEQEARFVRIPNEEQFYKTAFSRNKHIISPEAQEQLRDTRFGIVGLGVGSAIGTLLALSGAQRFVPVDGGSVNLHDHNRLIGADARETGLNHAVHWTRMALKDNPYLNISCYPQNLAINPNPHDLAIDDFIENVDIIIEEADNLPIKAAVRQAAKEKNIPVFMGSDLGMEGIVQYENPNPEKQIFDGRLTPEVISKLQDPGIDFGTKTNLAINTIIGRENVPDAYLDTLARSLEEKTPYWPQVGIAAFASASGVVKKIIKYLEEK